MVQVLPPKMTLTMQFFVDNIFPDIVAAKSACDTSWKLALYLDNALTHPVVLTARKRNHGEP
jgi:hypothetical protein